MAKRPRPKANTLTEGRLAQSARDSFGITRPDPTARRSMEFHRGRTNSPVARESGEKVDFQPFCTPRFLAFLAQNDLSGESDIHKPPLFNDLQIRRRTCPSVVSTRSLALTVETTLARRESKARRLDAAALPASLDGTPGTVVGWTPTRALGSARNAVRLNAAPVGALGRRRAGSRRWTRHAGRRDILSPRAGTVDCRQPDAASHHHRKEVSRHIPKAPRATPDPGPSPAGLP